MNRILSGAATALLVAGVMFAPAGPAAADGFKDKQAVTDWGPGWMIRGRVLSVIPDEDADNITVNGNRINGDIEIDDSVVPELDISYFFTPHIAAELILAVTPHDISGKGVPLEGEIGDVWLLPPTLLLQYHFNPGGKWKPYVGAGVNYTVFFNEDASGAFLPAAGVTVADLDLDDEFGFALQAGVDIHLGGNTYLNFDVKKLFLETDATVRTMQGPVVRADVDIDPWIVGVGLGWKFGGAPAPVSFK